MKFEYAVRIERLADSDGGGYLATVPDLPGCMSDGETPNGNKKFPSPRRLWRGRADSECHRPRKRAIQ